MKLAVAVALFDDKAATKASPIGATGRRRIRRDEPGLSHSAWGPWSAGETRPLQTWTPTVRSYDCGNGRV